MFTMVRAASLHSAARCLYGCIFCVAAPGTPLLWCGTARYCQAPFRSDVPGVVFVSLVLYLCEATVGKAGLGWPRGTDRAVVCPPLTAQHRGAPIIRTRTYTKTLAGAAGPTPTVGCIRTVSASVFVRLTEVQLAHVGTVSVTSGLLSEAYRGQFT